MFQVFKFILDLMYDSVLAFGLLHIMNKAMDVIGYHIHTQHEQRMAELNNASYRQDRLLK